MKSKELLKFEFLSQSSIGSAEGLGESFFSIIAARMGSSPFIIGLIGSAAYFSNLLSPLWARLSKRTGLKWLIIAGLIMASIFLFSATLFINPLLFLLFVILYYGAYGIREVLYPALVQKIYHDVSVLAHAEVSYTVAYTIAAVIAGYIMYIWSYKIAFAIAAFLLIVAVFSRIPFPNTRTDVKSKSVIRNIHKDRVLRVMVSMFMVAGTGMLMMLPAIPMLEVDVLRLSNLQIGFAIAINSASYVIFAEIWGKSIKNQSI